MKTQIRTASLAAALFALALPAAHAQKKYGPGVTNTEIKIGNTDPYSGPASGYGTIGKADAAYFKMINAEGGVNGRKIDFISLDDGYSPPRTFEDTRKLVEEDHVLLVFNGLGTPTQTAVWAYLNRKKVPQLFVATGATKWGDPKHHPWTMGFQPNYQSEGRAYAAYILLHKPHAKIGVLYQDDDYGKDYLKGLVDGLGSKHKSMIVKEVSYETTDPTVDSQMVTLKASGANVFVNITTPKFAAQAIREAGEIGWKPLHILNSVSNSVGGVLKPAGLAYSKGIVTDFWLKDPTDPSWKNDKGYKDWLAFMTKYYPQGDKTDGFNVYGYTMAQAMVQVLKQCGNDLTRANVMRQAANLHHLALPMLLPGVTVNTSPTDFYPVKSIQMGRFNGKRWVLFGPVMTEAIHGS